MRARCGRDRAAARRASGAPGSVAHDRRDRRRWCRDADTGPQRSQASIGSAIAPANVGPVSDQMATSPTAPDASVPISPIRPRHPAPPTVAHSSAIRGVAGTPRRRAAWRAASPGAPRATATRESADDDPSTPRPTCTPAARRSTDRSDARREDQVAARAVGDADAGRAEPRDLVGVRHHAVGDPRAVGAPAGAFEVLHRPAAERRERELVVLGVLGEVGVQAHVESLGELGRAHHQLLGDGERRARRERDAHHRAVRRDRGSAATAASLSARIVSSSCTTLSGGRPPSFSDSDIEPRVGWKRMPRSRAAAISAPSRSPAPRGCRYR